MTTANHDDPTIRDMRAALSEIVRGATHEEVAATAECSPNTIGRGLRGDNITIKSLSRIARAGGYIARIVLQRQETP